MICEFYNKNSKVSSSDLEAKDTIANIEIARKEARKVIAKTDAEHALYCIKFYNADDEVERVQIYKNTSLSEEELDELIRKCPNCYFGVLHAGTHKKACETLISRENQRYIRNIPLKEANVFVGKNHRHHNGTVGCKFAIGLFENDNLIGVAICGRPVSRHLDNGEICEINRLCTNGGANACSQLYGACARIAKEMGYRKIITYILKSESGVSLKASNFTCEGEAGGTHWTGARNRGQAIPHEMKTRWARKLA